MTYPPPPGSGDPVPPPDPYQPYPPYQPPQAYDPARQPPPYTYDYGYGYGQFGPPRTQQTDGFAIASLVVSCVAIFGLCTWGIGALLGILGAIFGHVARRRIQTSGAGGDGIALAGIIVGWVISALGLLFLTFLIVMFATSGDSPF